MNAQLPEVIEAIDQPHPEYGGWHRFLTEYTDLRDEHEGVLYFGVSNCNYIIFPSGLLVQNFGFNGKALMADVREKGAEHMEKVIRDQREGINRVMDAIRNRP